MSNCLVTKLKAVADNNNLPVLGVFTVSTANETLSNYEGYLSILAKYNMPVVLDIVQGHMYSDISQTTEVTHAEITGGTRRGLYFAGNSKVKISNKYGIESIRYGSKTIINLEDLDYLNNGENVKLEYTTRSTNPASIGNLAKLNTRIQLVENSANHDNTAMVPISSETLEPTAYSKLYIENGVYVRTGGGGGLTYSSLAGMNMALVFASVGNIENASGIDIDLGLGVLTETSQLIFNFDTLSGFTNLYKISISGCQRTGDYETFMKNNKELVVFACAGGNNMDVESVLNYWAANGKASNIKFNGPIKAGSTDLDNKTVSFSGGSWQVVS